MSLRWCGDSAAAKTLVPVLVVSHHRPMFPTEVRPLLAAHPDRRRGGRLGALLVGYLQWYAALGHGDRRVDPSVGQAIG